MAAPYPGKGSSFYTQQPGATPSLVSGAAMTRVGATLSWYITNRSNAWWDPNQPVVVYDGASPVANCEIDYAGGYVTLPAEPSGDVTVDVYTVPMLKLCGGYGYSLSKKGGALDATVFPDIAATLNDKSFIGDGLTYWTGGLKRHWWYALYSMETAISGNNNDLIWTWIGDRNGADEAIEYESGVSLEVTRASNVTTVTFESGVTTAAAIKAHVEADPVLSALWSLSYPDGNDGSGVVDTVAHTHLSGGQDSLDHLDLVGTKMLCVFYLENSSAVAARLEGVGILTSLNVDDPIETSVNSDLEFAGTGKICFHNS